MIYFDSAASTSPSQDVLDLFVKSNVNQFANPAAAHALGRDAGRELEECRKAVLSAFHVDKTHSLAFLSGATEANNLAIKGVAFSYQNRGKKLLFSASEHPSVTEPMRYLASAFGFEAIELPVDALGRVEPDTLRAYMDKNVILVSIMGVNNETGAINDLKALAKIIHEYPKAYFHSDLTQAVGKIEVPYSDIDLFSFSAHKLHGLKESGALVYKSSIRFVPLAHGGGQERGFRSGTVSLALNQCLCLAVQNSLRNPKADEAKVRPLFDALYEGLQNEPVTINSYREGSPYVLNFSLNVHRASVIMEALSQKGIYVSTTSACSTRSDHPSSTLLAMGKDMETSSNSIRVSFSTDNTLEEVHRFLEVLHQLLKEVHPR